MVSYWRQAGLDYIHYSQPSSVQRHCSTVALKPQFKTEVEKTTGASVKITKPKKE
ncbi:ATP synthase subunit epsilon, mitochondrial-like [Python bivittatus]|uniref:ATP synthase subunit epsilon, mitochondrial-like n=1 Tax=Python bivittatus TaxID=176946 RepID=A0A9F5J5L0_PYTBI|nr:ATP synthase subunit epsilon, mitochondrial-like [Python bivittatus]